MSSLKTIWRDGRSVPAVVGSAAWPPAFSSVALDVDVDVDDASADDDDDDGDAADGDAADAALDDEDTRDRVSLALGSLVSTAVHSSK